MERRRFLAAAAATRAGWAQAPPPPPAAAKVISSVMLWTLPGSFEDKLATVSRAGIQSVELLNEHARWTAADIEQARRKLRSYNLQVDLISAAPVSPLDMAEVARHLTTARKLGASMALLPSGGEQWASFVERCRKAGDLAAKSGITFLVEPMKAAEGVRLVKEVDHPHVRLLYDLYHEQTQAGDALAALEASAPYVKAIHVADWPGRADPGAAPAEKFDAIYKAIRKVGFEGPVAMEYHPAGDASASLIRAVDAMRKSMAAV